MLRGMLAARFTMHTCRADPHAVQVPRSAQPSESRSSLAGSKTQASRSAHAQRMSSLLASDKEDAPCQVERGACAGRGMRGREAGEGGSGNTRGAHAEGGPVTGGFWGQGTRAAERTSNMKCMLPALDVSKLSDWSKAVASYRVESRACDAAGEMCGPEGAGARAWGRGGRTRRTRDWRAEGRARGQCL